MRIVVFPAELAKLENNGYLNLLCPAGVGDICWILGKFYALTKTRKIKFWFSELEQHRAGQWLDLFGLEYGYLPGLSTQWVWDRDPAPPIPEEDRGWISLHPNRDLEAGRRLETWYPELPLEYPTPRTITPMEYLGMKPDPDWKPSGRAKRRDFIYIHPNRPGYKENLSAEQWCRIARKLADDFGGVTMVGAGKDEQFLCEIERLYHRDYPQDWCGTFGILTNIPIGVILDVLLNSDSSIGFLGIDGGPIITATVYGCPSYQLYPTQLHKMAGTWELPENIWTWKPLTEAYEAIMDGDATRFFEKARKAIP